MSLLDIHVLGSPVLRQETTPVAEVTGELRQLIDDMFDTMYAAQGIGLAAPQVGRTERLAVADVEDERYVLINPEIVEQEGKERAEEGCLSIPDIYGDVDRATTITFRAMDRDGTSYERTVSGLRARCIQHEIDHLHGKLFIDYLSVLRRRAALAKWSTMRGQYADQRRKLDPATIAAHRHRNEEL